MEKIYTIGNKHLSQLGFELIETPALIDDEIHAWVIQEFSNLEFHKLIIDISSDPVKAIKIALHIRLTLGELLSNVLVPILFISTRSLNQVLVESGIWSHIFATKGIFFTSYEKAINEVKEITGLKYDEYKRHFLNIINIQPDETVGRHSLANQWGAYILDKASNANSLTNHPELNKAQATLYFKFIAAHNFDYNKLNPKIKLPKVLGKISVGTVNTISAQNKKILLIDDEADKGWEAVLRTIFKTSGKDDFQVINRRIKDFESLAQNEKDLISNGDFDLFLVDLRLNGIEEEALSKPADYSGTKILDKIKEINKGNQVIMFTASNKAWNMKVLLDLGADGYYIKESPEYNFPLKFSIENYKNFQQEVDKTFRLSFLKEIYKIHAKCISFINTNKSSKIPRYRRFYERSIASLEIAFELLKKSASNEKYFNLAYLTYYQILEDYASQSDNFWYDRESGDAFVNENTIVIDGNNSIAKEWKLKYEKEPFSHFTIEDELSKFDITALSRISFILAFTFNKDNNELKNWGYLNHIRNTKAAHGREGGFVTLAEVKSILEFLELFLTSY